MLNFLHDLCSRSPLYGLVLRKSVRGQLRNLSQDNWPALTTNIQSLSAGLYTLENSTVTIAEMLKILALPKPDLDNICIHTFDFLRELHAIGDNNSRRFARQAIIHWIDYNNQWSAKPWRYASWELDVLGYRLCNWLGFYVFFAYSAEETFRRKLIDSIGQQYRYLKKRYNSIKDPLTTLRALKGLISAGCALPREHNQLGKWMTDLQQCLKNQFDDGYNHSYRHPETLILLLRDLIDLRHHLRHFYAGSTEFLGEYIARLAPIVRYFRHGDGQLSAFGGNITPRLETFCKPVISNSLIDMVLSVADSKETVNKSFVMQYGRIGNKSGLVFVNAELSSNVCDSQSVGVGEFEYSEGAQRLVSCGDMTLYSQESSQYLTAANIKLSNIKFDIVCEKKHEFLSFEYTLEKHPEQQLHSKNNTVCVKRDLCIFPNGELRGEDTINANQNGCVVVRFLAASGMNWYMAPDGQIAFLKKVEGVSLRSGDCVKRLLCQGVEQLEIIDIAGYKALCLKAKIAKNLPHVIKWALSQYV